MIKHCMILFLFILFAGYACAQSAFLVPAKKQFVNPPVQKIAQPTFKSLDVYNPQPLLPVANNYYSQHLPFFCRQELKMEQVHVPVKIRVGSIDDCNWLEQKPGYLYKLR